MTEAQHNRNYIKNIFKAFSPSNELVEQIRLFASERYVEGLRQKEFDYDMELQQENTKLKEQMDEAKENLQQFLEEWDKDDYVSKSINPILSKLKGSDIK